jgi:hypothetical protein
VYVYIYIYIYIYEKTYIYIHTYIGVQRDVCTCSVVFSVGVHVVALEIFMRT